MSNKNPLFVVTNNGQDVEQASNIFEAMVKKFGLTPALELLDQLFEVLIEMVDSYSMLTLVNEFLEHFIKQIEELIRFIDPVLAFDLFRR